MIAENAYPIERLGDQWVLCLDEAHDTLLNDAQTRTIERALGAYHRAAAAAHDHLR